VAAACLQWAKTARSTGGKFPSLVNVEEGQDEVGAPVLVLLAKLGRNMNMDSRC